MATKKQQTIASGNLRLDDLEKAGIRYTAMPEPVPAPEKQLEGSSTLRRFVGDTGVSLLKGVIGWPEAAVGVADLVTGGRAGQLAERAGFRPKEAKAILDEFYSPEQRAANAEVAKADGAVETLGAALSNPSTIAQAVFESAPSLLGAGAVARGALAVAPRLGGAAAAGIGEGVVSAGQTAEGVRQETADGLLTGEQAGISAASGVLTGLLGAVAGKVANRLGIGDINQMVAGVQNAGPTVQKGVARSIMEGFAAEGLLQELPQSAQEQIAQNIALGKPWDQGVGNAAVMGALAGGVMGGAAAPFGRPGADSTTKVQDAADGIRAGKLPETGVLTKSLNAGIEAQALSVETEGQAKARMGVAASEPTAVQAPELETQAGATAEPPAGSIDYEPVAIISTDGLSLADADDTARSNIDRAASLVTPRTMEDAQRIAAAGAEAGRDLAIVAHPNGEYMVLPRNWVTQSLIDAAVPRPADPSIEQAMVRAESLKLEGAPEPEVPAAVPPAPLALPYDTAPTGRLIAADDGVRPETRAEAINREQELGRKAELGLTPDVERVSMRAAMRNNTQTGDLLAASGFPFRNRRAAQAAISRAGQGFELVELAPDTFVGRQPAATITEKGAESTDVPKTEQAAEEAAAAPAAQAAPQADEAPANSTDLQGERLSRGWHAFTDESGTLQVPRSEMPQIRAEHRGALVNFLNARGVAHESDVDMPAADLKPTQAEFSPGKVAKARKFTGGDRSILVSSDGYVLDGHHQWLAKLEDGSAVKVIRLNAPMHDLLPLAREFPSSERGDGAAKAPDADLVLSRRTDEAVGLPRALVLDSAGAQSAHVDYTAAKSGDRSAAMRLAKDLVNRKMIRDVKALIGKTKPVVVPVVAIEATGRNKIPLGVAAVLAENLGLDVGGEILQVNRPQRTTLDGLDRLFAGPEFDGKVEKGADYLLVDDALTQGGTFAAMASHVRAGGGNVVGVVALSGKQYSAELALPADLLKQVREKFSDVEHHFRAATGYGFDALTASEARYLSKHRSPDAVRDRIVAEGNARRSGLDGSGTEEALSRSPAGAGVAAELLRKELSSAITSWKSGPAGGVHIVQSVADLPNAVRDGLKALDAEGVVRALFLPKTQAVYVVADHHDSVDAAQFSLFHEVYGHLGLRTFMGDKYADTLVHIQRANPHISKEANAWFLANGMAEIRARTERGMKPAQAQREVALLAVEEALADRAGRNEPIRNWQMLLARLQRGLRAIGLDKVADWMESKGQAEVMDLLARARKEVQRGSALAEEQGQRQMAMSRDSGPVLSREPGPAVAQVTKDLVRDIISGSRDFRRVSWWHKSVGTMFDMAQRHPAFKKVFDGAQAYLQDTSYFANDAADRAPQILPQLDGWQDLKKPLSLSDADRKAISAPIFEGTLNWTRDESGKLVDAEDVATAGVVFTPEELATRFGLNERQVGQYREFRAAVDRSLDSTLAADLIRYLGEQAPPGAADMARAGEFGALRDHIARHLETLPPGELAERIKAEVQQKIDHIDSLKARGYAPLMRFGKYSVTVTDGDTVKFFSLYESASDAARAARLLAQDEQFKNDEIRRGTMSQEQFKLFKGLSPETLDLFAGISGMEKNEAFQIWLKQATANRSALKRLIKRKGIDGYSEDVSRVLSSFITSNARAASQGLHFGEMQKNVSEIRDGDVKDAAERLREYVQNPTEEAAGLRGFLFVHFLGGSLASAAVNMTQPFMMTMPYLSKFVGIQGAAKVMASSLQQIKTQTDKDLREALAIAEKEGIVSPQELHQLQAMAMGRGSLLGQASRFFGANDRVAGAFDAAGKRAMFIWGAPFALAEQFNRRLTFIAAYQVAKEKAHVDPFKFAAQAVIETQGLYNRANRPEWARGAIGATLFTFKQYSISYLEFMHRLWNAGAPGSPERADGRKAALFGLALLILAAGAQGLPGADDLDDLIDTVGQKMGHDTNAKRWKQEHLPAWLLYGFSALPGIPLDVAGRLGIGNLIPGTGLLRKDKTDKSGDVLEIAGPAGSFVNGIREAADKGSLTPALPVAIANMLKGIDTARMGVYRNGRGQTVVPTDALDAAAKAIGFHPANVAAANRTDFANTQRINLARNVEAEIAADWASARFEGDAEGEKAARKRLFEWNHTNPETPISISSAQIAKRVQKMRQTRAERIQKSAPKEMRSSLLGGTT